MPLRKTATLSVALLVFLFSKVSYGQDLSETSAVNFSKPMISITPEAGVLFKFGRSNMGAMLGVRYNYGTNREPALNFDNIQMLGVNIGLVFFN